LEFGPLLRRGAIPTIRNPGGNTLLHYPVWNGTAATVGLLLEAGVNIEATNVLGETPLYRAAKYGTEDYLKELLKWGANVDTIDNVGRTALQAAVSRISNTSAAHHILHRETLPEVCYSKGSQAYVPTCRIVGFDESIVDLLWSAGADVRARRNSIRSLLNWGLNV
jgi:ankyrin repeat protein